MNSALIISTSEQSASAVKNILLQNYFTVIQYAGSASEARKVLVERHFDLILVNAPLKDEFGEGFAIDVAEKNTSQVIFIVNESIYEEASYKLEEYGIFTVSKPLNREVFLSVLKFANAAFNKISRLYGEQDKLLRKLEDIKLVNKAKWLLIEKLSMTEEQAHRSIEKQAMDMRLSRGEVSKIIIEKIQSEEER